jgi:hypothetical protein
MKENPLEDGLLRRYLLGELPEEEAEELERRFGDNEFFELAEAVEADLLAAAARGELAPAERKLILERLASSPQGRERLALARALNRVADEEHRQAEVVRFPRAAIWKPAAWSALAASLVAVIGLVLFMPNDPDVHGEAPIETSDVQKPAGPVLPNTPQKQPVPPPVQPAPVPDPVISEKPPVPEPVKSLAPVVLELAVTGLRGEEEGGEEEVRLTPGVATVEIRLYLIARQEETFESFNVALRKDQNTILQEDRLKPRPMGKFSALVLTVPVEKLSAGGRYEAYVQGVSAEGQTDLSTLEFEVVTGGQP